MGKEHIQQLLLEQKRELLNQLQNDVTELLQTYDLPDDVRSRLRDIVQNIRNDRRREG